MRRLLRYTLALAAAGAAVALLAAAAMRPWQADAAPRPGPLFTEADLPPLPPAAENGWLAFRAAAAELPDEPAPHDLVELLQHLEWGRARALKNQLLPLGDDSGLRARYAAARAALAAPRFADACALELDTACQHPRAARLHDLVVAGALVGALGGRWGEALGAAADLLRADLDLAATSRTALSAGLAQRRLLTDLALAAALLDGLEREGARARGEQRAGLRRLAAAAAAPGGPEGQARRAVIAEYVGVTLALRRLAAAEAQHHPEDWLGTLLLDPDQTLDLLNDYFDRLARFAERPSSLPAPPLPRYARQRFGWWAYNAKGQLFLDAALVDLTGALRQLEAGAGEIAAQRAALRRRLGP